MYRHFINKMKYLREHDVYKYMKIPGVFGCFEYNGDLLDNPLFNCSRNLPIERNWWSAWVMARYTKSRISLVVQIRACHDQVAHLTGHSYCR